MFYKISMGKPFEIIHCVCMYMYIVCIISYYNVISLIITIVVLILEMVLIQDWAT